MNREIKFRIWDILMQRWWCPDSEYLQMDGTKIHAAAWSTLSVDLPNDDIVIQQYTGLKDKNGKEIYEGDVLKIYQGRSVYTNDKWIKDFKIKDVFYNPPEFKVDGSSLFLASVDEYCEVIGNIFENPELLKQND